MECDLAIKMNKVVIHSVTWMNFETINSMQTKYTKKNEEYSTCKQHS